MTHVITREQAETMADSIVLGILRPTWRIGDGLVTRATERGGMTVQATLVQVEAVGEVVAPGLRAAIVAALTGCAADDAVDRCERVISDYLAEVER